MPSWAQDPSIGNQLINARWETAAAELSVHRHTLRYRMRKVEELTGRDLASSLDRMEFWLALRARDLLAAQEP